MRAPLTAFSFLLTASLSPAALTWTGGGDGISLYQEANWLEDDSTVPETNEVNPNVALTADTGGLVEIVGGSGTPSNYGGTFIMPTGVDLTVSNGKTLASSSGSGLTGGGAGSVLTVANGALVNTGGITEFQDIFVDNATIDLVGTAGITMATGLSTFSITNGGSVVTQFVSLGANITVDGTSSIEFLGGGDPINSQSGAVTVNLLLGGQLILVNEAEVDEHIGENEIFVDGTQVTPANRNSLLSITGGTAVAIPEPGVSLLALLGLSVLAWRRR